MNIHEILLYKLDKPFSLCYHYFILDKEVVQLRRYLLPENGQFYKANLHCHSTFSDGHLTPQQIKEEYMAHGYSIVAFTDHDILIPHPELRDENFLPLNGMELELHEEHGDRSWVHIKDCHMCFIALEPDNLVQPCYHRTKYLLNNAVNYRDQIQFDENEPDYERVYTPECVSDMMRRGREAGFFVTYNHPTWSYERYTDYIGYHGMHAMEIYNHSAYRSGHQEYNPRVYEDFLQTGRRLFVISADDNHNCSDPESPYWDSCGGFTMIKADNLDYRIITKALEAGSFYASQGPEIKALWFEDGEVHITCSPAKRIVCTTGTRHRQAKNTNPGEFLTEAIFEIQPEDIYIRLTVTDAAGNCADTNGYFLEDFWN